MAVTAVTLILNYLQIQTTCFTTDTGSLLAVAHGGFLTNRLVVPATLSSGLSHSSNVTVSLPLTSNTTLPQTLQWLSCVVLCFIVVFLYRFQGRDLKKKRGCAVAMRDIDRSDRNSSGGKLSAFI